MWTLGPTRLRFTSNHLVPVWFDNQFAAREKDRIAQKRGIDQEKVECGYSESWRGLKRHL